MLFDLIFLGLFFAGWLLCAYVPWVVLSVATRGNAGMILLPVCLFTGVVAALTVPVLGFEGTGGLWFSFVAAAGASVVVLALRRFAAPASTGMAAIHRADQESQQRGSTAGGTHDRP